MTPGISALEYAHRRSRLANRLPKNSIAVLAASEVKYRAAGIFYEYRQDTNFFYLTGTASLGDTMPSVMLMEADVSPKWIGFNEPGALAVIGKLTAHGLIILSSRSSVLI